jgi:hypothetical protein
MKKEMLLLATTLVLVFCFSSCKNEDEIYNPKCKIHKIWQRSEINAPDEIFHYTKKGQLDFIDFINNEYIPDVDRATFAYNKDKTVSEITYAKSDGTVEAISLTYNEKKQTVNKMVYKENGTVMKEVIFTRDAEEGKLTKIEEHYEDAMTAKIAAGTLSRFYLRFLGDEAEIIGALQKSSAKAMQLTKTIDVVYDAEFENIIETTTTTYQFDIIIKKSFQYDKGNNPYFGLPYFYNDRQSYDLVGFSKNNLTSLTSKSYHGEVLVDSTTSTYTYKYNNKQYPTFIVKTTDVPTNTYILYK